MVHETKHPLILHKLAKLRATSTEPKQFRELAQELAIMLGYEAMSNLQVKDIEIETVGFTVSEVCRTALEFAGGRKWLQFEDAETKANAKKAALQVVDKCMIARHTGGIQLLFDEIKAVSTKK